MINIRFNLLCIFKPTTFLFSTLLFSIFGVSYAADKSDDAIQKILKERTSLDFKVISNKPFKENEVAFIVVESPNGERMALLSSVDGSYIVPLNDGIMLKDTQNGLKTALDDVNKYNKDTKDKKALALFTANKSSVLAIPANKASNKTFYMILDTTCPYCLHEMEKLDSYLDQGNIEVLMVAFLGARAQKRTAGFYNELPNAKSRNDKIKLLKKVFTKDYSPTNGNDKLTKEITESAIAAGVQGVPYIVVK